MEAHLETRATVAEDLWNLDDLLKEETTIVTADASSKDYNSREYKVSLSNVRSWRQV